MVARPTRCRGHPATLGSVLLGAYLGALAVDRSRIVVRGRSMAPTLLEGDVVLTVPAVRRWLVPGQVVVLTDPADPDHLVIKRLHAIEAGQAFVLGDDPDHSTDSRTWGWVAAGAVRRRVLVRWPDVRSPLRWLLHRAPGDPATGRTAAQAVGPAVASATGQATGRRATTSTSGSSSATSPAARRP